MGYQEKFELVRAALIKSCKDCISHNWDRMFDMWLSCEADMSYAYQHEFKQQFSEYMNSEIESQLFFAGKNIVFAISAFMKIKRNASLKNVLDFTENFISEQLDDFDNWCDDIGQAMYEESSDYERDRAEANRMTQANRETGEDNPS
jgi:hypothetical protein